MPTLPPPVCVEDILADWLAKQIRYPPVNTVPLSGVLQKAEFRDTGFDQIKKEAGIRLGVCESYLDTDGEAEKVNETDAELVLVVYARVLGQDATDTKARRAARNLSLQIAQAIIALLSEDSSLDGKVCGVQWGKAGRDYDNTSHHTYAVVNIPLLINPTEENLN